MKSLYLLTLLFLSSPSEENTDILDILQSTETPPIVSFEEKVSFSDVDEIVYAITSVNIREKPKVDSKKISTAFMNQEIKRIGIGNNGWSQILYNDTICYINSKYLSDSPQMIHEESSSITESLESQSTLTSNIITIEGNVDSEYVTLAKNYFSKIPQNVANYLESNGVKIFITDTDLAQRFFANQYSSVMGCTVYGDKSIYIENRNSAIQYSMIHETGHMIDSLLGWTSSSIEFQDCYNSEKDSFVEVGKQDNHSTSSVIEYFAEVWNQSILYPESCQSSAPNSYAYVINIMNSL